MVRLTPNSADLPGLESLWVSSAMGYYYCLEIVLLEIRKFVFIDECNDSRFHSLRFITCLH